MSLEVTGIGQLLIMKSPEELEKLLNNFSQQQDKLKVASSVEQAQANLRKLDRIQGELYQIETETIDFVHQVKGTVYQQPTILEKIFRSSTISSKATFEYKKQQTIDAYEAVLTFANVLRSIAGQVIIPQLNGFIEQEQLRLKSSNNQEQRTPESTQTASIEAQNYYDYINSLEWRQKAEEAKAKAGNRCQICNRSRAEVQLEAHHRTYERLGNEQPEDITVLCRECHELYETSKKLKRPIKECSKCGKKFVPLSSNHQYCLTCFKQKRSVYSQANQNKKCKKCGQSFMPKQNYHNYCDNCFAIPAKSHS